MVKQHTPKFLSFQHSHLPCWFFNHLLTNTPKHRVLYISYQGHCWCAAWPSFSSWCQGRVHRLLRIISPELRQVSKQHLCSVQHPVTPLAAGLWFPGHAHQLHISLCSFTVQWLSHRVLVLHRKIISQLAYQVLSSVANTSIIYQGLLWQLCRLWPSCYLGLLIWSTEWGRVTAFLS